LKLFKALLFVCILIVSSLGFLIHPKHTLHYFWEKIPVSEAIFGFIGCVVLIIFAKALGRHFLERKETYYD
jgi:hypothetical protein